MDAMANETASVNILIPDTLLQHWQGHRRLTRKTIEAFPEDKLFGFSLGGMRPFSAMVLEFLAMAGPLVEGVATGIWPQFSSAKATTQADLLRLWDEQTREIDEKFPVIPAGRFSEMDKAFGQWPMTGLNTILYAIENEIHHRGQGYVYLRALGIEPPAFWDRD